MNSGKTLNKDPKVVLHFSVNYSKSGRLVTKFEARNLMSAPTSLALQLLVFINRMKLYLRRQRSGCW